MQSNPVKNGASVTRMATAAAAFNAVRLDVSLVPVQAPGMALATETATVPMVMSAATELALGTMEVVEREAGAQMMINIEFDD